MICKVVVGPSLRDAKRQIESVSKGSLLEFRLDLFNEWSLEEIKSLMKGHKVILTWKGDPSVYKELASLNPDYIDVEREVLGAISPYFPSEKIIASTHDFEKTHFPKPLSGLIEKVAVTPQSFSDVVALLNWCQEGDKRIGVSLGERGSFSRLLNCKFSSLWTYAPIEGVTAPGQIPFEEMAHVNEKTELFALIGDPVSQSIGHIYHNRVFKERKKNAFYIKIPITKEELPEAFSFLKKVKFKGLSVTMPLKEAIIPLLDRINAPSLAVNTVSFFNGEAIGINTDGKAALDAIETHTTVKGRRILLIGAGGAARAFAYEAKRRGAILFIEKNCSKRSLEFAKEFQISTSFSDYDILVNATPVDFPEMIRKDKYVFDMRTTPKWTPFLLEAKAKNGVPIFGEEMFFKQAEAQQDFWSSGS